MDNRVGAELPDWLIVGRSNNYGLSRDLAIVAKAIEASGSTFVMAPTRQRSVVDFLFRKKRARRILHIERLFPLWFSAAEENWLIPNQERFPRRHLGRLKHADGVLAKTRHAEEIFSNYVQNVAYLGFISEDRFDPAATRKWNRFFHLAGGSTLKGTEDVLALWAAHPEWPELVLVQKAENAPRIVPANVRLISGFVSDSELRQLQNECGVHLCLSRAEGWGHTILEAMSTAAVTVTIDAAPMNEHVTTDTGILVPASRSEIRHLGLCHYADLRVLKAAIDCILAMPDSERARLGMAARERYLSIGSDFGARAQRLLGPSKR